MSTPADQTRPNDKTRKTEEEDARVPARADREPTEAEEKTADGLEADAAVAEHEKEMAERGAKQKGEGRLP